MSDSVNYLRALVGQGLLMGWGDEAEAWLRSRIRGAGTYEQEREKIKREYGAFSERNPFSSGVAEFAGGVLPAVGALIATPATGGAAAPAAAAGVARTAGALSRLAANPYARGAATGLTAGGVSGAGSAEPGQRISEGVAGATVGAPLGAAIPAVMRGASAGYGWLRDRVAPSENVITARAAEKINRALQESGITPAEAGSRVAREQARDIPATLANIDPALVDLAETVAQRSGPSGRRVEEVIGAQREGARERTMGRVRTGLGAGDYYKEEQDLVSNLRRQASSMYDEAYAFGSVRDPRINRILDTPQFQAFYGRARQIADNEALAARLRGEDPSKYALEKIFSVDREGNIRLVSVPDVRTLDYIKRGMDDVIERGFDGKGISRADAAALREVRKEYIKALDEATTVDGRSAYQEARRKYAGDMEIIDAIRAGRNDFNKLSHEEIKQQLAGMSDAEKDAFRTGVARSLYDTIMVPSSNINAAQRIIGSPEMRRKLEPLFETPEKFELFASALQRESQLFSEASRMLGGSATARRTQARERFEEGPNVGQVVGDAVIGGFGSSLTNLAARLARSATITDDVATRVSQMLMSNNPTEVAAAVRVLEQQSERAARGAAAATRAELGTVSGTMAALPPGPAPSVNVEAASEAERTGMPVARPQAPRQPLLSRPQAEEELASEMERGILPTR